MKVTVDRSVCQGYGQCNFAAPTVFGADADGHVQLLVEEPPPTVRSDVENAAFSCPTQAITIED